MNKNRISLLKYILLYIIPVIFLVSGCRPIKEMTPVDVIPEILPHRVMDNIKSNQTQFDWFAARFTGNVAMGNQRHNISGAIRIKKDETIYLSIAPVLGIELARAVITPDTVKFLNRLESSYYVGDMSFINYLLRTSLDYDMLEAILIGNDFSYYDNDSFTVSEENGIIVLNDPSRKPLANPYNTESMIIEQDMWIESETYRIKKNLISEPSSNRYIKAEYDNYEQIEGKTLPINVNLLISDRGYDTNLSLQYMRVSINEPQQMNFSIPSRYEPIDF